MSLLETIYVGICVYRNFRALCVSIHLERKEDEKDSTTTSQRNSQREMNEWLLFWILYVGLVRTAFDDTFGMSTVMNSAWILIFLRLGLIFMYLDSRKGVNLTWLENCVQKNQSQINEGFLPLLFRFIDFAQIQWKQAKWAFFKQYGTSLTTIYEEKQQQPVVGKSEKKRTLTSFFT
jgi:hypothetical protein